MPPRPSTATSAPVRKATAWSRKKSAEEVASSLVASKKRSRGGHKEEREGEEKNEKSYDTEEEEEQEEENTYMNMEATAPPDKEGPAASHSCTSQRTKRDDCSDRIAAATPSTASLTSTLPTTGKVLSKSAATVAAVKTTSSIRLHNDALSSILAFLDSKGFHASLTVSRQWYTTAQMRISWPQTFYLNQYMPPFHYTMNEQTVVFEGPPTLLSRRKKVSCAQLQDLAKSSVYSNVRDLQIARSSITAAEMLSQLASLTALQVHVTKDQYDTFVTILEDESIQQRLLVLNCALSANRTTFPVATLGSLSKLRVLVLRSPIDPTTLVQLHALEYFECDDSYSDSPELAYAIRYLSVYHSLRHLNMIDYNHQTAAAFSHPIKRSFDGRPTEDLPVARLMTLDLGATSSDCKRVTVHSLCEIDGLKRMSLSPQVDTDDDAAADDDDSGSLGEFISPKSTNALRNIASVEWLVLNIIESDSNIPDRLVSDFGVALARWSALQHLDLTLTTNVLNFVWLLPPCGLLHLEALFIDLSARRYGPEGGEYKVSGYEALALLPALRRLAIALVEDHFKTEYLYSLLQAMKNLEHFERLDVAVNCRGKDFRFSSKLLPYIAGMQSKFISLHFHLRGDGMKPTHHLRWWDRASKSSSTKKKLTPTLTEMSQIQEFRVFVYPSDSEIAHQGPLKYRIDCTSTQLKWIECTNEVSTVSHNRRSPKVDVPPTPRLVGIELNPGPVSVESSEDSVQVQPMKKQMLVKLECNTNINQDSLSVVFACLDQRDFVSVMQVSKLWNGVSTLNTSWPHECHVHQYVNAIHNLHLSFLVQQSDKKSMNLNSWDPRYSGVSMASATIARQLCLYEIDGHSLREIDAIDFGPNHDSDAQEESREQYRQSNEVTTSTPHESHIDQLLTNPTQSKSRSIRVEGDGVTNETMKKLSTLPHLTALNLQANINRVDFDTFTSLFSSQLQVLKFVYHNSYNPHPTVNVSLLLASLGRLSALRVLELDFIVPWCELAKLHALEYCGILIENVECQHMIALRYLSVMHSLRHLRLDVIDCGEIPWSVIKALTSMPKEEHLHFHPPVEKGDAAVVVFINELATAPPAQLVSIELPYISSEPFHSLSEIPTLRRISCTIGSVNEEDDELKLSKYFESTNSVAKQTLAQFEVLWLTFDSVNTEEIDGFGDALGACTPRLRSLELTFPRDTQCKAMQLLPPVGLPHLEYLTIHNVSGDYDDGESGSSPKLPPYLTVLPLLPSLSQLVLSTLPLSSAQIELLLQQLRDLHQFTRLELMHAQFTNGIPMDTILNVVPHMNKFRELHIHREATNRMSIKESRLSSEQLAFSRFKETFTWRQTTSTSTSASNQVSHLFVGSDKVRQFRAILHSSGRHTPYRFDVTNDSWMNAHTLSH